MNPDSNNAVFQLAADFVNHTGRHIFLTGKAGTGKTTFLKHIQATTRKNCITVAPTGVAAINAAGVTVHSFFQLPLGPFLPVGHRSPDGQQANDMHSLFRNMRINQTKRQLMLELELLIIDEVSMVRADMLDAIDVILRHYRRVQHLPFGGVQVLLIGDMYQLPPVVPEGEWQLLSEHYASPFFFDAKVIQQVPLLYIELKKIYRQNEQSFIDILNRIRNNITTPEDLEILNGRLIHDFTPPPEEKYITLCTHNYKADQINNHELNRLSQKAFLYKGELIGEFNEKALPADIQLQLKEGAQVMFIKNDKGEERRFYNGKLATIKKLKTDSIIVTLAGSGEEISLEKETWRNIRYKLNETKTEIEEEELGTFTQYPIRLAWAITIHKSQGLTFEKAIIDAGQSFAAGQVYVALSRCTSLSGMVLYSRIMPHSINTDYRVIEFAEKESPDTEMPELLAAERRVFESSRLKKLFNWNKLVLAIETWKEELPHKKIEKHADAVLLSMDMMQHVLAQQEVAIKFQKQLDSLLVNNDENAMQKLQERMNKAVGHFTKAIYDELAVPLEAHIKFVSKQSKVKQYMKEVLDLQNTIWHKLHDIWHSTYNGLVFNTGIPEYTRKAIVYKAAGKQPVGSTRLETLNLFIAGGSIEDIAIQRNLAKSTIEGHLAESIGKGEILLTEVLNAERTAAILPLVKKHGINSSSLIKTELGDDYSFAEIRMVQQHLRHTGQ